MRILRYAVAVYRWSGFQYVTGAFALGRRKPCGCLSQKTCLDMTHRKTFPDFERVHVLNSIGRPHLVGKMRPFCVSCHKEIDACASPHLGMGSSYPSPFFAFFRRKHNLHIQQIGTCFENFPDPQIKNPLESGFCFEASVNFTTTARTGGA